MTPRQHAESLVGVFTRYVAERDDPVNRENLRVATEWLRLLDEAEPDVAEIELLASRLGSLGWAGCATLDLNLGALAWAARARRRAILRRPTAG